MYAVRYVASSRRHTSAPFVVHQGWTNNGDQQQRPTLYTCLQVAPVIYPSRSADTFSWWRRLAILPPVWSQRQQIFCRPFYSGLWLSEKKFSQVQRDAISQFTDFWRPFIALQGCMLEFKKIKVRVCFIWQRRCCLEVWQRRAPIGHTSRAGQQLPWPG